MKLADALQMINRAEEPEVPFSVGLAVGFTPLHLETFLTAELIQRRGGTKVVLESGLYGDLPGTLARFAEGEHAGYAVVLEWSDLDPRLGYRATHCWRPGQIDDVLASVGQRLGQLAEGLTPLGRRAPTAVSLPSLFLPPRFLPPRVVLDPATIELKRLLLEFAARVSGLPHGRVVEPQRLDQLSPPATRHDPSMDLGAGFPYQRSHAAVLASLLAAAVAPAAPLKGIITDLDHTLWRGILGEDGVEGVSWDLDHKSQGHALYQEQLQALSEIGVLVGVATKNEPALVEEALSREDLVIQAETLYPIEASWGAKSVAVGRILGAWNIGAQDVVFIDDSPLELEEVRSAWPELHTLQFPATGDEAGLLELLGTLRDIFGKETVTEEDTLRAASLRSAGATVALTTGASPEEFLANAGAELNLEFDRPDQRCFELVNKTNQFNLNGRRLTEAQWQALLDDADTFLLAVTYRDKFGPLGKIAVALGRRGGKQAELTTWVMSCRAFSRRIEHHMLAALFERLGVEQIKLDFQRTARNGPLVECLEQLIGETPEGPLTLDRETFNDRTPRRYGEVTTR